MREPEVAKVVSGEDGGVMHKYSPMICSDSDIWEMVRCSNGRYYEVIETDATMQELVAKYLRAGEVAENLRDDNTLLRHENERLRAALRQLNDCDCRECERIIAEALKEG